MRIETERLVLRDWEPRDLEPYSSFVADPEVRRFYPDVMTREQSDAMLASFAEFAARDGYGFLAVERKSDGRLMGDAGICPVDMPFRGSPPVELGYLLGREFWGNGYAVEAARAWIGYAFDVLGFAEVAAWTAVINGPSQRVMQKLGMSRDPADDFLHPKVPEGHALRPHVLYRIKRPS